MDQQKPTPAQRQAEYKARQKAQGLVWVTVWAKPENVAAIKALAEVKRPRPTASG